MDDGLTKIYRLFPLLPYYKIAYAARLFRVHGNLSTPAKKALIKQLEHVNSQYIKDIKTGITDHPTRKDIMKKPHILDSVLTNIPTDIIHIIQLYAQLSYGEIIQCVLEHITNLYVYKRTHIYHSLDNDYTVFNFYWIPGEESHIGSVKFSDTSVIIKYPLHDDRHAIMCLNDPDLIDNCIKEIHTMDIPITGDNMFVTIVIQLIYSWRCYTM